MCTRVCTTDRDRPGKMAVTKSVPVMMSQTISTAADLGLLQFFFYQSYHRKKCVFNIYYSNKMTVIVRINYSQHLQKGNIKLASTVQWE